MLGAALIEIFVGVTHGVRLAASQHHLEIDRSKAIVLVAMDYTRRARDTLPGPESCGKPIAVLLLDEPMIGLDPRGQRELRDILIEIRGQGGAIVLVRDALTLMELGKSADISLINTAYNLHHRVLGPAEHLEPDLAAVAIGASFAVPARNKHQR